LASDEKEHIDTLIEKYHDNIPNEYKAQKDKLKPHKKYGLLLAKDKGAYDVRNKINDLGGKEWVYFLNSVEVTRYPTNGAGSYCHHLRKKHPSPKPPQLMEKFIKFFTKEGQVVFDPFAGVGGTLIGASICGRQAIGVDLSKKYKDIYLQVVEKEGLEAQEFIVGDAKKIDKLKKLKDLTFDFILTDPPYGEMLSKERTGEKKKKNNDRSATPFTGSKKDLGNMTRSEFLSSINQIIEKSIVKLKDGGYVAIFVKDFQPQGKELNMLHYDVANELNKISEMYYKGMKIWYDKTINLYPFGYPYAYTMNQLHQYILIFRKGS